MVEETAALDFRALWGEGQPWAQYVEPTMKNHQLWDGVYRRAQIPTWALDLARPLAPLRLLVLAEDWCGDAANTVPVMQRLAEGVPGSELRVLERDQYPLVMDRYLTNGTRSIPIAIGLDSGFRERGHWGPRPAELQAWVMANQDALPKDRRYAEVRRWYATDKGETTVRELLSAISGS
jgi:hypothetical protein